MRLSEYVIKKHQAGIAMPVIIIVVVVLIGLSAAGYFFLQRGEEKMVTMPEEKVVTRSFIGGWRVEKIFGLDAQGQWSESTPAPHKPTYVEFGIESACFTEAADLKCESYLAGYEVSGDIISFPGATGSRFRWKMIGEKLEIVNEDRMSDSSWSPSVKFISVKVQ